MAHNNSKAQEDISIHVGLDDFAVVQGVSNIRKMLSAATKDWQNSVKELDNVGKHTEALEKKYSILSNQIKESSKITDMYAKQLTTVKDKHIAQLEVVDKERAKLNALGQSIGQSSKEYQEQNKVLVQAENLSSKLERQFVSLERKTQDARRETLKYTTQLKDTALEIGRYDKQINELTHKLQDFSEVQQIGIDAAKADGKALTAQRLEYEKLAIQLKITTRLLEQEEAQLKDVKKAYNNNDSAPAVIKQQAEVRKLTSELSTLSGRYKELNSHVGQLSVAATNKLDKLNASANKLKEGGSRLAMAGSALSGYTNKIVGAFAVGVKDAIKVQDTYVKVKNLIKTGATSEISSATNEKDRIEAQRQYAEAQKQTNEMQKEGVKYSMEYGVSQEKIAEGNQELIKRGYSASQALGSLKPILDASVASGDDFNKTLSVSTQALEAFGFKTKAGNDVGKMMEYTKKVTNEMAYAADLTATDFGSLGKAMEYVGSTAHTAHYSLAETSASIGILSNNGLEAEKAGTGMRKAINSLLSPTDKAKGAMDSLGINIKDSKGHMYDLAQIFQQFHDKMAGMSNDQKVDIMHTIFGTTGQQAAMILSDNADQIDKLTAKVKNAVQDNYVEKLAEKNQDSAKQQLAKFKETVSAMEMEFASDILPYVQKTAVKLMNIVDDFNKLPQGVKTSVAAVVGGAALVGPLLTIIGGISTGIGAIKGGWAAVLRLFSKSPKNIMLVELDEQNKALLEQIDLYKVRNDLANGGGTSAKTQTKKVEAETEEIATNGVVTKPEHSKKIGKPVGEEVKETTRTGRNVAKAASRSEKLISAAGKTAGVAMTGITTAGISQELIRTNKGKETSTGATAGLGVGAGLGAILGSIIPGLGTAIGAEIGATVGPFVGSAIEKYLPDRSGKNGKKQQREENNYISEAKRNAAYQVDEKTGKVTGVQQIEDDSNVDKAYQNYNNANGGKQQRQAWNKFTAAQNKQDWDDAHNIRDNVRRNVNASDSKLANNMARTFSQSNVSAMLGQEKETANSLAKQKKQVDDFYNHKRSKVKADFDYFVKTGVETQKEADAEVKRITKSLNNQQSSYNKHYNQLTKIDKTYHKNAKKDDDAYEKAREKLATGSKVVTYRGQQYTTLSKLQKAHEKQSTKDNDAYQKQRVKVEKEMGNDVNKTFATYGKSQLSLAADFVGTHKKLNRSQLDDVLKQNNKAYKDTVNKANDTYNKTVKTAKKKRDDIVARAYEEYSGTDKASKEKRDAIISKANAEYNKTTKIARDQRDEVTQRAKEMKDNVTKHASEQATNHTAFVQAEKDSTGQWYSHMEGDVAGFVDKIGSLFEGLSKHAKPIDITQSDNDRVEAQLKNNTYSGNAGSVPNKPTTNQGFDNIMKGAHQPGTLNANARGGSIDYDQISVVGEQGPEAVYNPDAAKFRIVGQNGPHITKLNAGDYVLNASDTHKLMTGTFGRGTVLNGFSKGTESIDKLIGYNGPGKTGDWMSQIMENRALDSYKTLFAGIGEKLKSRMSDLETEVSAMANPGGGGADRWVPLIKKAAKEMHVDLSGAGLATVMKRINQESGGNPTIGNFWDSNAQKGTPSVGLLQYIQPTLDSWVPKGVQADLTNGYTQLLALFNDSNWLADISVPGGWGPSGFKRYANGGIITKHQIAEIGEDDKMEAVVPMDISKRSRGYQVMSQIMNHFAQTDAPTQQNNVGQTVVTADNSDVVKALGQLLQVMQTNTQAIYDTAITPGGLYNTVNKEGARRRSLDQFAGGSVHG